MSSQSVQQTTQEQHPQQHRLLLIGGGVAIVLLIITVLSINTGNIAVTASTGGASMLILALPAFLAGILSFLSPCTLPILPAYFAFTCQANRQNIVMMTVAFFLGLATTMTFLGAGVTATSAFLPDPKTLTFWGGLIVIGFGIMSLLGKGFAGPQMQMNHSASVAGSYFYGATFALGWTACVGPILGALLTLLASQGLAILQGAILSFIYAMGLGLPLIIIATFFSRMGSGSRFWQIMRGRGYEVHIGPWTLYLHTTSILSGILLIVMGILLTTGQLTQITALGQSSPLSELVYDLESAIRTLFGL